MGLRARQYLGNPSDIAMKVLPGALKYYVLPSVGVEGAENLGIETLKALLKWLLKELLALQQQFIPTLESLIEDYKKDLDNALSEALAQIHDLTPEEVEVYIKDFHSRLMANTALTNNLRTLALPLHIARQNWDQPGWKAKPFQPQVKIKTKSGRTYLVDILVNEKIVVEVGYVGLTDVQEHEDLRESGYTVLHFQSQEIMRNLKKGNIKKSSRQ